MDKLYLDGLGNTVSHLESGGFVQSDIDVWEYTSEHDDWSSISKKIESSWGYTKFIKHVGLIEEIAIENGKTTFIIFIKIG